MTEHPLLPHVRAALHTVEDPEIRRPITDLGMVDEVRADDAGSVFVRVLLTVSGCPMRSEITTRVTGVAASIASRKQAVKIARTMPAAYKGSVPA